MTRSSERGAILINVAISLLGLTLFSAFVIDQGILYVSKRQAQNSADAGALAAAIEMEGNPDNPAVARTIGKRAANVNEVWNQAPAPADVLVDLPITCPPDTGGGVGCVRVDVLRGARDRNGVQHTNYLPTIFAQIAGIDRQGILATATAQVISGNSVTCIKPWIVADKWQDSSPDTDAPPYFGDSWDRDDTFVTPGDTYDPTKGFNPTFDTGYEMPLKPGNIGTWSSGWAMEIDFGQVGSAAYKANIEGCPTWVPTVGIFNPQTYGAKYPNSSCNAQNDPTDPALGCLSVKTGMSQGPTSSGVNDLIALDPSATWIVGDDPNTTEVEKGYVGTSCMNSGTCLDINGAAVSTSPRIVPIAIFDTTAFTTENCSGTGCVAQVVNLGGFFIEGMCFNVFGAGALPSWCGSVADSKKIVIGRFMKYPGQLSDTAGSTTSSFAKATRLVR